MSSYFIPPEVIPGFEQIVDLTEPQLNFFKNVLDKITEPAAIEGLIKKNATDLKIPPEMFNVTLMSLISMTEIYWRSKDNPEKFSEDFTQSFIKATEQTPKNLNLEKFKKNISFLASGMGGNMRNSIKAREIITANQNNYQEARIISDVRIVYDDDDNLEKKDQLAVIVHNLRIRYSSVPRGQVFISLDLSDLYKLREVINRAIEKDKLIRTNAHQLTFVDPK
jgi:mRNA-degrading endonuclease YafQ of YafQ-DinJ toxin-antitoxin module